MGNSCEEEVQLRLIAELRGLYREAAPTRVRTPRPSPIARLGAARPILEEA